MESGSVARLTTALVWPRSVRAEMVVAEARGSISVMWRADVPTARRLREDSEARERREWDVERVSTDMEVVRSQVRSVWSQEAEYATV